MRKVYHLSRYYYRFKLFQSISWAESVTFLFLFALEQISLFETFLFPLVRLVCDFFFRTLINTVLKFFSFVSEEDRFGQTKSDSTLKPNLTNSFLGGKDSGQENNRPVKTDLPYKFFICIIFGHQSLGFLFNHKVFWTILKFKFLFVQLVVYEDSWILFLCAFSVYYD